jgi:hypothetical protein
MWLLRNEDSFHPVFQMSPRAWRLRIKELKRGLATASDEDRDRTLIELCDLDPRFLGTEYVIARVLDLKLQLVWKDIGLSRPEKVAARTLAKVRARLPPKKMLSSAEESAKDVERAKAARRRVEHAKETLDAFGAVVSRVTGRGMKGYKLRSDVQRSFRFHLTLFTDIREQLRKEFSDAGVRAIAEQWGLDDAEVRDLKSARRLEGRVDAYLASSYGVSPVRIRALRTGRGLARKR